MKNEKIKSAREKKIFQPNRSYHRPLAQTSLIVSLQKK